MTVDVSVEGVGLVRRLTVTNKTQKSHGVNTYEWVYTDHSDNPLLSFLMTQQGELEHVMEDGIMVLIAKVAQAASETEE